MHLDAGKLRLRYTAKGGKKVGKTVSEKTLLRTLHKARDLPDAELVTWVDDDGTARAVSSGALNDYLADAGAGDFSAKTFRTWASSLAAFDAAESGAGTIKTLSEAAAHRLANTPTVARNSYIHPKVIALLETRADAGLGPGSGTQSGTGSGTGPAMRPAKRIIGLSAAETRLVALLES